MASVTLRLVEPGDSEFIWQLRNSEDVQQASLQSKEIPRAEHEDWFRLALREAPYSWPFYIVMTDGTSVGYLRLSFLGSRLTGALAEISIALHPSARGQGVGTEAIKLGVAAAREQGAVRVHAAIKPFNAASQQAFANAGFHQVYQVWEHDGA